jgi:hypothetical protein
MKQVIYLIALTSFVLMGSVFAGLSVNEREIKALENTLKENFHEHYDFYCESEEVAAGFRANIDTVNETTASGTMAVRCKGELVWQKIQWCTIIVERDKEGRIKTDLLYVDQCAD